MKLVIQQVYKCFLKYDYHAIRIDDGRIYYIPNYGPEEGWTIINSYDDEYDLAFIAKWVVK